jgi:hypothetical protein
LITNTIYKIILGGIIASFSYFIDPIIEFLDEQSKKKNRRKILNKYIADFSDFLSRNFAISFSTEERLEKNRLIRI